MDKTFKALNPNEYGKSLAAMLAKAPAPQKKAPLLPANEYNSGIMDPARYKKAQHPELKNAIGDYFKAQGK